MAKTIDYKVVTRNSPLSILQESIILDKMEEDVFITILRDRSQLKKDAALFITNILRPWEEETPQEMSSEQLSSVYEETLKQYKKELEGQQDG